MRITHPNRPGEVIVTPCRGCYCHDYPIQMGSELLHGCCPECGCPKDVEGWEHWQARIEAERAEILASAGFHPERLGI